MKAWAPGTRLDILVCGLPIERIDGLRPYGYLNGNATRAFGLANNLALQGHRVGLMVEPGCEASASPLLAEELQLVPRPELEAAAAGARVLLLACTNLKVMAERLPEAVRLDHPRKWMACCFDHNNPEEVAPLVRGVTGISFNNGRQAEAWKARGLPFPVHVQPYGVDEHAYGDEAIRAADRPVALWIGVLRMPRQVERIVRFAEVNPECEVQVVSGFIFDQELPAGTPGSLQAPYVDPKGPPASQERFGEIVRILCGRAAPPNLRYLGPCPGRNDELIGGASLALGFSRWPDQPYDDSKILDYLRGGAPVLCDDGQPAHRFVTEFGHGFVLPFHGGDASLRLGFLRCMEQAGVDTRRAVAARVGERYGWPAVARQVAAWIEEDGGPVTERLPAVAPAPLKVLYIPWINGHTGALVKHLERAGGATFLPLDLAKLVPGRTDLHRFEIMGLANEDPARFSRLLGALAEGIGEPVNALMVTADWSPGLRHAVRAFREAGFPTVLVPHESVFAQEELYYFDPDTGANRPEAELSLLWGGLQADIFRRRGLPPERLRVAGSPKLDFVAHYRSPVAREAFYARWGLPADRPVLLFATQPMDIQFETTGALAAQSLAIAHCLELAAQHDFRLVVRLPPARSARILGEALLRALEASPLAALDGAREGDYLAIPEDALFHADVVLSVNSTMLLEASLMDRPALSVGYVACDQFWHRKGGLPLVQDRDQLEAGLKRALDTGRSLFSPAGWEWIRWAFSPGAFDGAATTRILQYLGERFPGRALPRLP